MEGYFITFEGIDGSGKTVQAERLLETLKARSVPVRYLRDPGATTISERIRSILLDTDHTAMSSWTELLLYEAARAQMVEESIQPALSEGKIVVCDRFYDSTTAYQGYGRQLDLEVVSLANRIGSCGLTPDLSILLDLDIDVALTRKTLTAGANDRLEKEDRDFHERVRKGYLEIARMEPQRVKTVQADKSIDVIEQVVWQLVADFCHLD